MNTSNNTLVFDTALAGLSVGVVTAEGKASVRQIETAREQASLLIPVIQEVLEEVNLTLKDVDLIGTTIGPGSFTGVRIGMTTAKTLAMALDCPVVGLNTLDVMAHHYEGSEPLLCVLETKRQDFYGCYYDAQRNAVTEPMATNAIAIIEGAPFDQFTIGGDCLERFQAEAGEAGDYLEQISMPDPIVMAQLTSEIFEKEGATETLKPLYLRDADTSEPKVKPRQLEEGICLTDT
ncbi:MAG: tRNA (adenosine(37)-N6)-threonylcarbamoyltransferase complex dimerization subunit type 1 TsaB [Pseudomonadota bacterium]